MTGQRSLRLFVACDLPPAVAAAVERWQALELGAHPEVRAVRPLHLTLCFLGNVPEARVPEIERSLTGLDVPRLPVVGGTALFLPERGKKRVVALRLEDPSGALVRLQGDVSATLAAIGVYDPERRVYLPHVTVARYRHPGPPFSLQNVNVGAFGLPSVILYTSVLERGGAVHTPLATFPASD